jgi:hypothetical protein
MLLVVLAKPFQPEIMFVSKPELTQVKHLSSAPFWAGSWPYLHTSDQVGKASQGQTP